MRFQVTLSDEVTKQVKDYANEFSIKPTTACAVLIRQALRNKKAADALMVQMPDIMKAVASNPKVADVVREQLKRDKGERGEV